MVNSVKKSILFFFILSVNLTSCENDIFGIFGADDFDARWQERNTFNFLNDGDRNISLPDKYSFLVVNDTHIYNGNTRGIEKLKDVIDSDIKFIVFNGDITQNGKQEDMKKFLEIVRSFNIPCYPAAGNHDVYFGNWPVWKELIGSTAYRINGGSADIFILDSANAFFGKKQLDWLENELIKTQGRVFIFTHANLATVEIGRIQQLTSYRERAKIISMLDKKCDMMFMGHIHRQFVNKINNVLYITMEDFRDSLIYCHVKVSKDNVSYDFKKLQ